MSNVIRLIDFTVVIRDSQHWTEEHKEQLANTNDSSADFVYGRLRHYVIKAAREYASNNPDLFIGDIV